MSLVFKTIQTEGIAELLGVRQNFPVVGSLHFSRRSCEMPVVTDRINPVAYQILLRSEVSTLASLQY